MKNTINETAKKLINICKAKNEITVKVAIVNHYCNLAKCDSVKVMDIIEMAGIEIID